MINLNRLKIKHDATNKVDLATYGYGTTAGSIGLRTSMNDPSGSTAWVYSNYGRTVQETRTIGTIANKISTTASDWLGRVLTVQYPDQETISYTYDALGRAKNASGSQAGNLAISAYKRVDFSSLHESGQWRDHYQFVSTPPPMASASATR